MVSMNTTFSGDRNHGSQVGSNYGHMHQISNYYIPPEGTPIKPKPSSTVPFRRDPDFVDRNILAEVDKICSRPASRVGLVGLGGVGKSQLAIEYSYRIRDKFPQTWIFWVHASNAARFEECYRNIADRIELPHRNEPTADILRLVSNWLSNEANGRWIMILDNADDATVFSDPRKGGAKSDVGAAVSLSTFLPQTPNGSILVTSRSGDAASRLTGRHHDIIQVDPMDEDHALLLFENKLRGEYDRNDAKELLRALDYMPLAISQAAAYLNQRAPRTTVAAYLDAFRKSDKHQTNLLYTDTGDIRRDSSASNSIIATWQISFEYLRIKCPSATRLLSLMSFFDRQGIPESFIRAFYDNSEDSDTAFEDTVFVLTSYSLIRTNVKNDQFEMHRLVQFSTKKWLELNRELEKWKKEYIGIIWNAFPTEEYENWKICRVIFPHAEAMLAYRPTERKDLLYWSEVLYKAGSYAETQGNLLTAEEMNRRALEERTKALGKVHPDTLASVNNLAMVLLSQGKYEAAEEMNRRALEGREEALGKEHPKTLTSVNNLAIVLCSQGKYIAAEEMSRRALAEQEKALGREHPETLTTVGYLALTLKYQGKYEAAEEMSRRALDGKEKALGKEHPETLMTVGNLATMLLDQGKYTAAEEMSRRALDGKEKALGKEHPVTLMTVGNLAMMLKYQGKYTAAEEMSRRALAGQEKALGKEHPVTLTTVGNLALTLQDQGKYDAAEEMSRRALDGKEKALGKEHPETLLTVGNLALTLQDQGKYDAAEEMSRRALDGKEKALGEEHPSTLTTVYCLACIMHRQKRYKDAIPLYERSCAGHQKVLGTNHPHTLVCSRNYASMIEEMNQAERGSPSENAAGHPSPWSHRISAEAQKLLHKVFR